MKGTPDTGCTTSLIRNDIVKRNKIIINKLVRPILKVADSRRLPVEGTARLNCMTASGERADIRAIATTAIDEEMLISFKDLETLKRIPIGFPNTVVEQCKCFKNARAVATTTIPLEEEFQDIISDELNPKPMNCTPMKIERIAGATPSKNMYTKRVPLPFEKEAEKVLQDLIDKGVITRVHKPSIWCHPAFFLPKPDGKRVRLVTDYTSINKFV